MDREGADFYKARGPVPFSGFGPRKKGVALEVPEGRLAQVELFRREAFHRFSL